MIGSILTSLGLILAGYIYFKVIRHKPPPSLKGKHVIITGGSKGIGRAMAFEAVKLGANVTIVARDMDVLEKVKIELLKIVANPATQKIEAFSVDVSASSAASSMEQVVAESEEDLGPVYMLINCAGTSISGTFEDTKIEEFHRMMNINLMGSVMCTKAVVSSMKKRNEGVIIFVSSIAGLLGLYGYSAYSASKFAVVGLAEVLAMELRPYNIKVSVSFPPDTDTPGFEEEQKGKPRETQLISESGGLYQPNVVAQTTLADALDGKFSSTVGIEGLMIRTVCSGMMPPSSIMEVIWQVIMMPLGRIIAVIFLHSCSGIVDKCKRENDEKNRSNEEESSSTSSSSDAADE